MAVERDSGTLTETEWKRKEGMELLRAGMKQTAVARKVGVNRRTVYELEFRFSSVNRSPSKPLLFGVS